ncbi:MAG: hypothetical protein B9S32_01015 [Verrucomicrobia bacterium Tous-C9LFEB]|nr:MAG: hypothetical protein B9S32_01015 [Verrucomicrobia bacterium Tous-C9LFEB]
MKNLFIFTLRAWAITFACTNLHADVTLPAIISDHMVLQRASQVPVWGKADPGEGVSVTIEGQNVKTEANSEGRWATSLNLEKFPAGPFEMTVEGKNKILIKDVLVGEVWVASGQSNMEMTVKSTLGANEVINNSANNAIREFSVAKKAAPEPVEEASGRWVSASPEKTGSFSAVGYFFARKLNEDLNVPVGIINTSWGGTPSQSWTSVGAIEKIPEFKVFRERIIPLVKEHPEKKRVFVEQLTAWIKKNQREDKPVGDAGKYADVDISSEGWVPVTLPGPVTAAGLPEAGAVWLRKTIDPPQKKTGIGLSLPIDGFDSIYWNGKLIARTSINNFPGLGFVRQYGVYTIPVSEVRDDKNVLAIRLYQPVGPAAFSAIPKAGATPLQNGWIAKAEFAFPPVDEKEKNMAPSAPKQAPAAQNAPAFLFNGMVNPILPYAIKGVVWYQGESNVGRAYQYRTIFPLLITDWREHWKRGDFPFYFVQLANFQPKKDIPGESAWAELREAQSMTLNIPNTGQAVAIDIGEAGDIHPRNKKDVGERLAAIALANDYGKNVPFSGPIYESMKIESGKIELAFRHAEGGLVAKPLRDFYDVRTITEETAPLVRHSLRNELEGFAICGEDKKWVWADARIVGDKLLVWSDAVPNPVAVRYAWADNPTCNLYNGAGLPASPFRTDEFGSVTKTADDRP